MSVRPITFNPDGSIDRLSRDVLPSLALDDLLDGSVTHSELTAQSTDARSVRVQAQDLLHSDLIKFGATTLRPSRLTSLHHLIRSVVLDCPKKQMLGVAAQSNITDMADAQPRRNLLIGMGQHPGYAMGTHVAQRFACVDTGVPSRWSSPQPTRIRSTSVNVLPEPRFNRHGSASPVALRSTKSARICALRHERRPTVLTDSRRQFHRMYIVAGDVAT